LMKKIVRKEEKFKKKEVKKKDKEIKKVERANMKKMMHEEKQKEKDDKLKKKMMKKDLAHGEKEKTTDKEEKKKKKRKLSKPAIFIIFLIVMIVFTVIYYIISRDAVRSFFLFSGSILLFSIYLLIMKQMAYYNNIKKMELVFPDFISLMSSNLRAGMTVDRALLMSARKEFAPLDKEISQVGKDILTGREINESMKDLGRRTKSEEIQKTIQLIISGIRSGGNLSVLLEETATNMRERVFVKKRASSNVLMYVIFMFALSTFLISLSFFFHFLFLKFLFFPNYLFHQPIHFLSISMFYFFYHSTIN